MKRTPGFVSGGRRVAQRPELALVAMAMAMAMVVGPSPIGASDPTFTAEQAGEGGRLYRQHCSTCHGLRMRGEHITPALVGDRFEQSFRGKPASVLAFHLERMPPEPVDNPGGLGDEVYGKILAYILQSNGFEAGDVAMPAKLSELADVELPRLEGSDFDPYEPVGSGVAERLAKLSPVTGEMLKNPPEHDWLQNGRTYAGHAYSPLKAINKDSVDFLSLAWRAPLREGMTMPMPIVHDGIMFLHTFPDTVIALDATTGEVLWRFTYEPEGNSSQKAGVALHGDKIFVPTSDLHVVALEAKTGKLIWDHELRRESEVGRGYNLRSAPLVVKDKVIQGVTASFVPKGGFLVAIDIETGEEAWRFHSIARPGNGEGESWNELPIEKRSGGSIWHQGTYDPELDLIYYGIAPTYDTAPLMHPSEKSGVTADALYTNSTVALDPDTGELAWHYQHLKNDQWDLDWVFERQIVDVEIGGETRRAVMNAGKMAILEAVDAKTGEYLFSVDTGMQNVITAIDPKTGEKTIDMSKWPDLEKETLVCPSALGARSWPPTSYSPRTRHSYLPLNEICMTFGREGGRLLTSGVGIGPGEHPDAGDGELGRIQAIDVANQKLAWLHEQEALVTTGILSTGGGLVFVGDLEPSLKALDDETGEILWQARLDDRPSSGIITYSVEGRQFVAVVIGVNNLHLRALSGQGRLGGTAPSPTVGGGPAIWVYSL